MKRLIVVAVLLILASGTALAGIAGTKHDLSANITGTTSEICVFCHTPHGGADFGPLWNHSGSAFAGADYGSYSSATMNATAGTFAPNSANASANCMTCHDGTVGVGALYNEPNTGTVNDPGAITTNANLGTDLSNDHPVNFDYTASLATEDGELEDPANINVPLFGGQLQCATCHDPHSDLYPTFLTMDNTIGSALCLDCHQK